MTGYRMRELLTAGEVVVAPCVYDCASARAVELVGFKAMMLSGGELSIAMNGVIDYGFTNLTDTEWMVSRLSQASPLALAVDVEDGYGGPLAVYRSVRRLIAAGAQAVQLEDSGDMEESTKLLPREKYYEKVRAALAAMKGTDAILIARTNADPATELDEGCERMRVAHELGAEMTTVVKLNSLKAATYVAERVPGWKMYPDVMGRHGVPEVTVEQIAPLGFNYMTMHYTLKAAMDGMIEHGVRNVAQQGCLYTMDKADATGVFGCSATPLFDPQAYMELESRFTLRPKEYTIVGNEVEEFPAHFANHPVEDRL
ncbi:MAG: isocitrate lyase/phosphoenolpyruvate mutase family protein [Propionibacteriaceae bacterium]|nr:isocitrate lyase/phosphoenolpyruvate mutase family protein [Propionibacteriaceae bacterium]